MSDIVEWLRSDCDWPDGTKAGMCKAAAEIDRLRETLEAIERWSRAYPLAVFPEPDLKKAHALLKAGGLTLDAVSASAIRHVITQVGEMARRALERKP